MKICLSFVLLGSLILLGGNACARRVVADTYAVPDLAIRDFKPGSSFHVLANPNAPNPIFDRMVKEKIEILLASKGYQITSREQADYWLEQAYGMVGHEETRIRTVPYAGAHHHFHFSGRYYDDPILSYMPYTTLIVENYPVYTAQLRLKVVHAGNNKDSHQVVWVGETWTDSLERDLRAMIDYLLAASLRLFGKDTRKAEEVKVAENDPLLKALRQPEVRSVSVPEPAAAKN